MRYRNFILLALLVVASGTLFAWTGGLPKTKGAPTPFPHGVHRENELECIDCHEGAREEDQTSLPTAETCVDCHDDPEIFSDAEKAFFEERDAGEGKMRFYSSLVFEDLKFSHKAHVAQGTNCKDCHGNLATGAVIKAGDPDFKHTCLDCHDLMKASTECVACHDTYTRDAMPASHKAAGFGQAHGGMVEPYFRQLPEDKCFFCHEVSACETCHRENPPAGHESPHFEEYHGDLVRSEHKTMADANCSVCHDAAGCDACHQQREPRSHTVSFKNRTHGLTARIERKSCQTCHQQTFCTHCHTSVEPLSHRGQFARGQQNHCLNCHVPRSANRCMLCHRAGSGGHLTLPMPADATHLGATQNSCRVCHAPVPHADNGMNCMACH